MGFCDRENEPSACKPWFARGSECLTEAGVCPHKFDLDQACEGDSNCFSNHCDDGLCALEPVCDLPDDRGGLTANDLPTAVQYVGAVVQMTCDVVDCQLGFSEQGRALCLEQMADPFDVEAALSPSFEYDAGAAARCVNAFTILTCADLLAGAAKDICGQNLEGILQMDDVCSGTGCAVGLYCDESATCPGTCQPLPAVGEECTSDCAQGSSCQNPDADGVGHCVAYAAEGEECGSDLRECLPGLLCDAALSPGVCRPHLEVLPPAAPGGACQEDVQCGPGLFCDTVEDVCASRVGAGGECTLLECQRDLYCNSEDHCASRIPTGQACPNSIACAEGFCIDGVCDKPVAIGEPCTQDAHCFSFNCLDGECVPLSSSSCEP